MIESPFDMSWSEVVDPPFLNNGTNLGAVCCRDKMGLALDEKLGLGEWRAVGCRDKICDSCL